MLHSEGSALGVPVESGNGNATVVLCLSLVGIVPEFAIGPGSGLWPVRERGGV